MVKHLILQKNNRLFLLIEYPDRYHIITVNKRLDLETEEWILASICADSFFDDAGLTRETIPKSELRGVSIGGNTAGRVIVLYQGKNKHRYILSDDYGEAYIDEMFTDVARFTAPKSSCSGKHSSDWRKELQDPRMENFMSIIGSILNVAGGGFFFICLFCGDASLMWFLVALSITFTALAFYLKYPQYYSLMGSKQYKKAGYTASVTHLEFAVLFPLLAISVMRIFEIRDWTAMLIWMAVISAVSFAALYFMSREIRENDELMFIVLILTVFISFGITFQVNHQFNFNADPPTSYAVTEKTHSRVRKGPDRYRCTVILDDGSELDVDVPMDAYHYLQEGDEILVYIGKGALGIEYAYFVEISE